MESNFYHLESKNTLDARPSMPEAEMFRDLTDGRHLQQEQQQVEGLRQQQWAATEAAGSAVLSSYDMVSDPQSCWKLIFDVELPDLPIGFFEKYGDHLKLFQCCVCSVFSSNSLNELREHVLRDRSLHQQAGIPTDIIGANVCELCGFRTDSKEDLHVHCSTREHLKRVDHVNHVKEGGVQNEWKLKHADCTVLVQCTACGYFADCLEKLKYHVTIHWHLTNASLFVFLEENAYQTRGARCYFCALCNVLANTKVQLIQHTLTITHMKAQNVYKFRNNGNIDWRYVFLVRSCDQVQTKAPRKMYQRGIKRERSSLETSVNNLELRCQEHKTSTHFEIGGNQLPSQKQNFQRLARIIECFICGRDHFRNFNELESHIVYCHSLERLLAKNAVSNFPIEWGSMKATSSPFAPFETLPNALAPPPPYPGLQVPFMQSSTAAYPLSDQTHINQHSRNIGPPVLSLSRQMLCPRKTMIMDSNSTFAADVYVSPPLTAVRPTTTHPYMVPGFSPLVDTTDGRRSRKQSPRKRKIPRLEINEDEERILESYLKGHDSPDEVPLYELIQETGLPSAVVFAWVSKRIQRSKSSTNALRDPPLDSKNADEAKVTESVAKSSSLPNATFTQCVLVCNENQENVDLSDMQREKSSHLFSNPEKPSHRKISESSALYKDAVSFNFPAESKALSSAAPPY